MGDSHCINELYSHAMGEDLEFRGTKTITCRTSWVICQWLLMQPLKFGVLMRIGTTNWMVVLIRKSLSQTNPICNPWCWYIYLQFTYITGWFCSGKCWDSYSSTMVRIWDPWFIVSFPPKKMVDLSWSFHSSATVYHSLVFHTWSIWEYGDGSKPWYQVNPKIAGKFSSH